MTDAPPRQSLLDSFSRAAIKIPHSRALNLEVVDVSRGEATILLPYDPKLVGDPDTGILHGGVITTAMDNAMGLAVFSALDPVMPVATLDLRLDYLKPATPGLDIKACATCYKVTRHIAFVRGLAYHDDKSDPIANGAASFMIRRPASKGT
jgi:uncharacterized protein (TIGR00369 family)